MVGATGANGRADFGWLPGTPLRDQKQSAKGRASFTKAMSSTSAKRAAAYTLAKAFELEGKKPEAKAAYTQYAKLYPGGPWAAAATAAAAKL